MPPAPRLLIRLGSMGDVVLATAAANALRSVHGDRCVDVLVKEEWAELWNHHPAVNELLVIGPRDRGVLGLGRWGRRLRAAEYHDVVDLQVSPRTRVLKTLARWSAVRRPRRYTLRRRLLVRWHRGGPPRDHRVVDAFVQAAVPGARARPSLYPGPTAQAAAERLLGPGRERVGLAPGARYETKRWPLGRYVELGRWLVEQGRGPIPVFFGPDEARLLAAWRVRWPGDGRWIPVREGLETTAACLGKLRAVVTNDTGLMHVADAMRTPVVAIFGPTVRRFGFTPMGERARVIEIPDLPCRPCSLHGGPHCPQKHFRCMLDVDVDAIAGAVEAALRPERAEGPGRTRA